MPETAVTVPLVLEEGIPWGFEVTMLDALDNPVPLHGYTFLLDALESITKRTPFIHLTTENGAITVIPDEGKVIVFFDEHVTRIKQKSGIYDFVGFSPSKVPFKIQKGALSIIQTVSQWE